MKFKILKLFLGIVILMASCQKDESSTASKPDTSIEKAYDTQKTTAANKEIHYTPNWTAKQESNGDVYVPLKADKIIRQIIGGKKQPPINDNIWLRGTLKNGKWTFSILQVYPDNFDDKYKSGMVIFEDLASGKLSKSRYMDPSLYKDSDPVSSGNGSPAKKALDEQPPCKQVLLQVCAGEGEFYSCDTRLVTICDDEDNEPMPPTTPPPGLSGGVILPPNLAAAEMAKNTPNAELGEFEIDGCKTTLDEPDQKNPQQGDPKKIAKVDWKYTTKRGTVVTDWTDNTGRKHTHIKMNTYYTGFFKSLIADFFTTGTGVNMVFDMFKAGKLVSPKNPGGFYADDAKYITEEMHEYYQAKQQRNQQNGTKCKP